jgi:uncharacterized membrane protein YhiD involved in acid resistance
MVDEFQNIFVFSISAIEVISNIMVALFCGLAIALLYKYTYKGLNYSASFTISLVLLTMITAIVIMVIGNNLARAFGMVGAMSIIRFRTAVKDASDIMFIFFALSIGLAAGVKLYALAVFGTFFVGLVYFILGKYSFALPHNREYLLQLTANSATLPNNPFEKAFEKYCKRYKLVNVKSLGEETNEIMEFSYYINLRDEINGKQLVGEVKSIPGVKNVNLFFDEN